MRRATNKFGVIELDGQVAGVALGNDYCAEHEWGFHRWGSRLGIPKSVTRELNGPEARTNTRNDLHTVLFNRQNGELVLIVTDYFDGWHPERFVETFLKLPTPDRDAEPIKVAAKDKPRRRLTEEYPLADVRTAWSDSDGFMIVGQTDRGKEAVKVVYDALQNHRLAVGYGAAGLFENPGLNLLDTAKAPQSLKDGLRTKDIDYLNLQDAVAKTGIKDRLEAAGLRYFALSPRWQTKDDGTVDPSDPVVFYLNPFEQQKYNYGWFTVAELDAWIAGKGPIPKSGVEDD